MGTEFLEGPEGQTRGALEDASENKLISFFSGRIWVKKACGSVAEVYMSF